MERHGIFGVLILTTLLMTPVAVTAQESLVAYVEGDVEYAVSDGWRPVDIGSSLPPGATVRIGDGGFLEVLRNRNTYRYTEAGEFTLADDGSSQAETTETDFRGLLRNKFTRLAGRGIEEESTATVAGVRASEAAAQPEVEWAGAEDPQELIAEGLELMNEGAVEDASFVFEEAYDFATGVTFDEAGFFFSYALYLLDENDYALDVLSEIDPTAEAPYYADYVLVAAELHLTAGNPREAEELLAGFLNARPAFAEEDPLSAQAAHYLYGRALSARSAPEAPDQFRIAADLAPGTALAEEARQHGR
ncbi:MAG TPA: hypothetical protein VJ932_11365 [Alkalispirochaeta sp.]|nr:hypothetical protein [Alkalispirochaeta sp.]